jgi:hypothetical protein
MAIFDEISKLSCFGETLRVELVGTSRLPHRNVSLLVRPYRFRGFRSAGAVPDPQETLTAALEQILATDQLGAQQ